jgi:hypothetical protein
MEKMPFVMILFLVILYAGIAYVVLKSAYNVSDERPPY